MKMKALVLSCCTTLLVLLNFSVCLNAQQETILLNLSASIRSIGVDPQAHLLRDRAGNLYGTTSSYGPKSQGTVFELTPDGNGSWKSKILHAFLSSFYDGQRPEAGLIFDAAGNLYGTTYWGGLYNKGCVFELMPQADGSWKEKLLHSFGFGAQDGQYPQAGVIFDSHGNLYGTTMLGGSGTLGTVYLLIPQSDGTWKEKVLHSFTQTGADGYTLLAGLVMDHAGNLYGSTVNGVPGVGGTVFELSPTTQGPWKETILHTFAVDGVDGYSPYGTLIFDTAGNLYGTTFGGGAFSSGTAFELSPAVDGSWTETILHNFSGAPGDGSTPYSSLIFDVRGNLYGITELGGLYNYGTVFKMSPASGGGWTETPLHSFGATGDGQFPLGSLIFDNAGNLYGMTDEGGSTGYGTVYEITP